MTTSTGQDRSTVWLVVATDDGEHDVVLHTADASTAGPAIDALCRHLGLETAGVRLHVERLGAVVEATDPMPALRHGDRVILTDSDDGPRPPTERASGIDLVVRGGPLNGTRVPLPNGDSVIGRGSGSDVTLADPALSRAHLRVTVDGERVTVVDAGSTNGTFIAGRPLTASRVLARGDVVEAGTSLLTFERAASDEPTVEEHPGATVSFNRPPRVRAVPPSTAHELEAPPPTPTKARLPLAASLVPLLLGVVMVVLFPENKAMLLFFAFTPVMAVWSLIEDRRTGRRTFAAATDRFNERVGALERTLEDATAELAAQRRAAFPAADELHDRAARVQPGLWERRPRDEDFLHVRVGWGDEPSGIVVNMSPGGDEELRARADARLERFATLPSVPVPVDLRGAGVTGLAGPRADVEGVARWIVAQIATMTSPEDVTIAAVVPETSVETWSWLKWLPHVSVGEPQTDARLLASTALSARAVVEGLTGLVRERETSATTSEPGEHHPHHVLLIDESVSVPRADLAPLLRKGPRFGVSIVWLGTDATKLPGEAGAIVEVDVEADRVAVTYPAAGQTIERSAPDILSPEHARAIATALAPVRDAGSPRGTVRLPATVDLLDVLASPPEAEAIRASWSASSGLDAVIGRSPSGPFRFDLRTDGPHCLIGGTTGAGKSELLQTIVGSLATRYPPARLNFILVDYKGGTAFKDCIGLPHVVGAVTDLDGSLASRALVSLDAEIKRRERVLRDAGARDLQEMERSGAEATPPNLVLVIDEFATLVKELPEFVEGVVDIAQRGRALGIHLILATQRPAGVISERIRANTNLRIALRVGDDNDSVDVIGAPDAARIDRSAAGRGFARIGHAELVAFQAAFGGRPAPRAETGASASALTLEGPTGGIGGVASDGGRTQLQEVVAAVVAAHGSDPAPFRPWLPPLPAVIPLTRVTGDARPLAPALGVVDEPGEQRQSIYRVDLDEVGSIIVYGTSGAGKTTLLRTLALSLASATRPDEMHIYGLDFSTHGLRVLEGLPHVGSIVTGDEEPRVRRLLAMIRAEIATRRELLADAGVTDLASYLRVSPVTVPRIVVLLDGYAGFSSTFEKIDLGELVDLLPRLIADGRQLGIHFVLTAERRGVVPGGIAGLVGTRIVMRMADDDEYAAAGADARPLRGAKVPAGRAFVSGGLLMQVAIATDDGTGTDELTAIAGVGKSLQERFPDAGAPPVRLLPDAVERASVPRSAQRLAATIGIDEDLAPVVADMGDAHFIVAGPYRSGRSTALAAIAMGIARSTDDVRLHLLAPRRSPLTELSIWSTTAHGTAACEERAASLVHELTTAHDGPVVIVIDDLDELSDGTASDVLARIARMGRDAAIRVLAASENHGLHRAFGGVATELRKDKNGLLLDPDLDVDGDLLGVRLPRRKSQPFPPGRGYLVRRGTFTLVQIAI